MELWLNLPLQLKLKISIHFDRYPAMPALPKQTVADDLDEHRDLLLLATMNKLVGEKFGEKNEATPQTGGAQSIPHDRLHARLPDECGDRHHHGRVLACTEIPAQFGDGERGHSALAG